jgi:hypothetical protein
VTISFLRMLVAVALLALAGCAGPPPPGEPEDVARLAAAIAALGPGVDRAEARRAAQVSYSETHRLALAYEITDPPIVHNTKVNLGIKPRGLCWHWARDMEDRLAQEGFETLDLHRAVANSDNSYRLEHSTVIVSARGAAYDEGIVLDPWRAGGRLTWVPVRADAEYRWEPRIEAVARKLERKHGAIVTPIDETRLVVDGVELAAR